MPSIRIYEPALCCNTGVCGPDVDQSLVDVTAAIRTLQSNGIDIERYNLANDPSAFVNDDTARAFLQTQAQRRGGNDPYQETVRGGEITNDGSRGHSSWSAWSRCS